MVQILITAYLTIGALAAGLIWMALIASKRRDEKTKNVEYRSVKYNLFREPNTKPSRFHL